MKNTTFATILIGLFLTLKGFGQNLEEFPLSDQWLGKLEPSIKALKMTKQPLKKKVLIFSLHTGFKHWTIPHTERVMALIAENPAGFEVKTSKDIGEFEAENLKNYDAVILNNNCSEGDRRNLFWDVLKKRPGWSEQQKLDKSKELEENLLAYVRNGHGLMVLHGAIVMQNKSPEFGKMIGGSFDYHPIQQDIHIKLTDPEHPMLAGFDPNGFVHRDEPYIFKDAYFDYNFKPLLYMETDSIIKDPKKHDDKVKYVSWIKKYGRGRVFYCSPSHNAQSMENPQLLQYFLNGLLYVTNNLNCDDSPLKIN